MFGEIAPKLRGNQPPQSFGSQANQTLATDVAINASTLTTILSLTLGPGTYLLFGRLTVAPTGSASVTGDARLYDSTAGITLASGAVVPTGYVYEDTLSLIQPLILTSAHVIQLQVECSAASTAKAATYLENFPGATNLFAVQIAGGVMQLPPVIGSAPAFTSAAQTITTSSKVSVNHNLGRLPNLVRVRIKCLTAEYGYAVGDEIIYDGGTSDPSGSYGMSIAFNTTSVYANMSPAPLLVINGTGFAAQYLTSSNWALYFDCW